MFHRLASVPQAVVWLKDAPEQTRGSGHIVPRKQDSHVNCRRNTNIDFREIASINATLDRQEIPQGPHLRLQPGC